MIIDEKWIELMVLQILVIIVVKGERETNYLFRVLDA